MTESILPLRKSRRFLCLYLPYWATERFRRSHPAAAANGAPLVLYEKKEGALRLFALDEKAGRLGFHAGQALAEARAAEPSLEAAPADPAGDEREFRKLLFALTRYSPFVGRFGAGEAVLDVTGCAHLFGGEAAVIDDAIKRLSRLGFSARVAIADAAGAAHAAALYSRERIIPPGGALAALRHLPVAALRLSEENTEILQRLGLKRIGQLYDMPRAPLTARLGAEVLQRLAQALGEEDEPIAPVFPPPDYEAAAPLQEPIVSAEAVLVCLEKMTRELEAMLERDASGGRRFELILYRVDNHFTRIAVGAVRPERKPEALFRLFKDRLADGHDERNAGFGYDLLRLRALDCAPYEATPASFDAPQDDGDLAGLVSRLSNRLGERHVCALHLANAHMPERSARFAPWTPVAATPPLASEGGSRCGESGRRHDVPTRESRFPIPDSRSPVAGCRSPPPSRPVLLLSSPEPIEAVASVPDGPPMRFIWRRIPYAVKKASGPERLCGDWRREPAERPRDYYRIEDERGRRFWVYREGLFGEGAPPKWFLHGVFG